MSGMNKKQEEEKMETDYDEEEYDNEEDDEFGDESYTEAMAEAANTAKTGVTSARMKFLLTLTAAQLVMIYDVSARSQLNEILTGQIWKECTLNEVRKLLNVMYNKATFYQTDIAIAQGRDGTTSEIVVHVENERSFVAQLLTAYGSMDMRKVTRGGKVSNEPYFKPNGVDLPIADMAIKVGGRAGQSLTRTGFKTFCNKYVEELTFDTELPNLLPAIYLNRELTKLPGKIARLPLKTKLIDSTDKGYEVFSTIGKCTCFYEASPVSLSEVISTVYRLEKCTSIGGDLLPKSIGAYFAPGETVGVAEKNRAFSSEATLNQIDGLPDLLVTSKPCIKHAQNIKCILVALANSAVAANWAVKLKKTHTADLILCKIPCILFHKNVIKQYATSTYFAATTNMPNAVYYNWRSAFSGKPQIWRVHFEPVKDVNDVPTIATTLYHTNVLKVKRYVVQTKTAKQIDIDEAAADIDPSFLYRPTETAPNVKRKRRDDPIPPSEGYFDQPSPNYVPEKNLEGSENFTFQDKKSIKLFVFSNGITKISCQYGVLDEGQLVQVREAHNSFHTDMPFCTGTDDALIVWGVAALNEVHFKLIIYAAVFYEKGFYTGSISR
jgi:hypothetical protein